MGNILDIALFSFLYLILRSGQIIDNYSDFLRAVGVLHNPEAQLWRRLNRLRSLLNKRLKNCLNILRAILNERK
jgi:hypothetical protein